MKLVILGAGGLLGQHVVSELRRAETHTFRALARSECDIVDLDQTLKSVDGFDLLINCAAFTNVDGAETHEDDAYRINALGAENVARAASAVGAKLVHVSTDFVFDGAQPHPYDEFARPNPQSVYARSKWVGEELARARCSSLFLVRVQGLYGRGGTNFSSRLRQLILDGNKLQLDGERRVQPTWARSAARQLLVLAAGDAFGTYHVSCKGETTWAGFTARLATRMHRQQTWNVVGSDALAAPAKRPPNCLFHHRMLALRGIDGMPSWESAQDEYLAEEAQE